MDPMTSFDSEIPAGKPVQNLRVRFWGVQGSCPIFPTPYGIHEYSRRLAVDVLSRMVDDIHRRSKAGPINIDELIGGLPTRSAIEAYQRRIGLPEMPFYGGETTCVEVETSEGNIIIFDAGSGIRRCSLDIARRCQTRADRTVHLFGSHEHLDHRSGLSFARFCYVPEFTLRIYGSYAFLMSIDHHYGIFSREVSEGTYVDDPIDYTMMSATFAGQELSRPDDPTRGRRRPWAVRDLSPLKIGSTTVTPFELYHVGTCCLGYKVEHNGKSFVFATDHELRHGQDDKKGRQECSLGGDAVLRQQCRNADLAYFDGQYFRDEYDGKKGIGSFPPVKRIDWGHGCVEDLIARAVECNIKHTLVGHHDPERTWPERVEMDHHLTQISAGKPNRIQLADSDVVVDL